MVTEGTVRIRVHGRVQGVGFRWWTLGLARELGLSGWVRNEADGSVTILARGRGDALERLESQLRMGPPASRVESVDVTPAPAGAGEADSPLAGFEVRFGE